MRRDQALDHDLGRIEPVEPHAAREHELHGGERGGEREEAGPVEADFGELVVGRQGPAHADGGADADRHQHVERPAPAIDLGEIAAEHRTERRRDRDRHAEDRHHHRVLAARERIEQDRLRQRHDRRAGAALQDAPQHQHLERLRHAAQQCRQREAGRSSRPSRAWCRSATPASRSSASPRRWRGC